MKTLFGFKMEWRLDYTILYFYILTGCLLFCLLGIMCESSSEMSLDLGSGKLVVYVKYTFLTYTMLFW